MGIRANKLATLERRLITKFCRLCQQGVDALVTGHLLLNLPNSLHVWNIGHPCLACGGSFVPHWWVENWGVWCSHFSFSASVLCVQLVILVMLKRCYGRVEIHLSFFKSLFERHWIIHGLLILALKEPGKILLPLSFEWCGNRVLDVSTEFHLLLSIDWIVGLQIW